MGWLSVGIGGRWAPGMGRAAERTGEEAKKIIFDIVDRAGCKSCIKSKSMVSEEIELAHALEARGMDVVETDLGEFIVQIDHLTVAGYCRVCSETIPLRS